MALLEPSPTSPSIRNLVLEPPVIPALAAATGPLTGGAGQAREMPAATTLRSAAGGLRILWVCPPGEGMDWTPDTFGGVSRAIGRRLQPLERQEAWRAAQSIFARSWSGHARRHRAEARAQAPLHLLARGSGSGLFTTIHMCRPCEIRPPTPPLQSRTNAWPWCVGSYRSWGGDKSPHMAMPEPHSGP